MILGYCGDFAGEELEHVRALALNPNDANIMASYGVSLAVCGRAEEGIARIREAMRLNPHHPEWYWMDLGSVLYMARRYGDAIEAFKHRTRPDTWVLASLAACHAELGQMEEATRAVAGVLQLKPGFSLSREREGAWSPLNSAHFRDGMRKAGLPD